MPAVEAGDAVPLALLAEEEREDLPGVPLITDLAEAGTEEAQLLRNYMTASGSRILAPTLHV